MSSTQVFKKVMVLGARGNLGTHLIPALQEAGFEITTVTRSPPPSHSAQPAVQYVQSDYTLASLVEAFSNQDAVISTIATHDVHAQKTIVDACVAAGIKRFLPSEFGSDTSADVKGEKAGFLTWKREVLEYVKSKEADGLEWTAVYTGAWIDWLLEEGYLGWDLRARKGVLYDSGEANATVSTFKNVIRAIVAVLRNPGLTKNQYVHVSSFNVTQRDILEALERVSGDKFDMESMKLSDLRKSGDKHVAEGKWELGYSEWVTATNFSGTEHVSFREKAEKWNKLLGIENEETFDDMIRRVLRAVEKSE